MQVASLWSDLSPCVPWLCHIQALPGSQVSVDVPWSPYDIDGRFYDWQGLAEAADLLFVMVYDTQVRNGPGAYYAAVAAPCASSKATSSWSAALHNVIKTCTTCCVQSRIYGRCIASANSPLDTVRQAVHHWLTLGVPPAKLVLGLPWYVDHFCWPWSYATALNEPWLMALEHADAVSLQELNG